MCTLSDFDHLALLPYHRDLLIRELEEWHDDYLPATGTVLDIGAGCGETALFYLNHGAARVIAIEGDPEAFVNLHRNFGADHRVVCLFAHLDNVKLDIEGAELGLNISIHFPFAWRETRANVPEQWWNLRLERARP